MKTEYKVEIADPEFLLLSDINERVKNALSRIRSGKKIEDVDLKSLEIDKDSINLNYVTNRSKRIAKNLIDKIDYIIETQGEKD